MAGDSIIYPLLSFINGIILQNMEVTVVMAIILLGLYVFSILAAELTIWRWVKDPPIEETAPLPSHEIEPQDPPSPSKNENTRSPAPPSYEDVMKSL